jgi:hypothetical protein
VPGLFAVSTTAAASTVEGGGVSDSGVPALYVCFPLEAAAFVSRTGTESELRALGLWLWRPSADRRIVEALSALAAALAEVEAEGDEP